MKKTITIIAIILVIALIGWLCYGYVQKATKNVQNPIATMEVEGYGKVKIELYPQMAPNTVSNFIRLANRGYYDGLTFHRIVKDFMIQGGDKQGNGQGSPSLSDIQDNVAEENNKDYSINGEFIANGFKQNTLRHDEGVISMARGDYSTYGLTEEGYNSAGSQFFIVTKSNSSLNGLYSAFGKVIEGMDVVHKIEEVEIKKSDDSEASSDTPVNPPVIKSITVETYGVDYGMPETHEAFDVQSWFMQNYSSSLQ